MITFPEFPLNTFLSSNMPIISATASEHMIPTFGSTESMFFKGHPLVGFLSRFYNVGLFGGAKAEEILIKNSFTLSLSFRS